jgi:hypothetical protein
VRTRWTIGCRPSRYLISVRKTLLLELVPTRIVAHATQRAVESTAQNLMMTSRFLIGLLSRRSIVCFALLQLIVFGLAFQVIGPGIIKSPDSDQTLYFNSSRRILEGLFPYRDFALEYPPFALPPLLAPWLMGMGRPLGVHGYNRLFALENALISVAAVLVIASILSSWKPRARRSWPVLAGYTAFALICGPLLTRRYDLFPALLTLLALAAILRDRATIAGILIGLGVTAKIYPAVLVPVFCAFYVAAGNYRALRRLIVGCASAAFAVVAPFALLGFEGFVESLRYHQMRGLQLESVPAGVLLLGDLIGLTEVQVRFDYGAVHLTSPLADRAVSLLPVSMVLLSAVVVVRAFSQFRSEQLAGGAVSTQRLCGAVVMSLLAFIATNKVFSPQYVIWLIPFAPMLRARQALLFGVICGLTIVIFPFEYGSLMRIQPLGVVLLNLRNLLLIGLMVWLLLAKAEPPGPDSAGGPAGIEARLVTPHRTT